MPMQSIMAKLAERFRSLKMLKGMSGAALRRSIRPKMMSRIPDAARNPTVETLDQL